MEIEMLPYSKFSAEEISAYIDNVKVDDVKKSLAKDRMTFTDYLHFISKSAVGLLDEMHEKAAKIKLRNFGRTMRLYAPLYISSYCINGCVYCGFRCSFQYQRRRLSFEEVMEEAMIIKSMGHDSLLLITGEDPKGVSVDFTAKCIRELKKHFAYINIEYYPMSEENYRKLFEAGCHGLTIYQETYDPILYKTYHPSGPKADYDFRLKALESGGRAGFYNLGMGALLGLNPNWRLEAANLAIHGLWTRKNFWRSRTQFSFPRITPTKSGYNVPNPLNNIDLEQLIVAIRLLFQESDLFLSTREASSFRMKMADVISHMSAGSQVAPGAYKESLSQEALGQFSMNDRSSVKDVLEDLRRLKLEPIFKDWDKDVF